MAKKKQTSRGSGAYSSRKSEEQRSKMREEEISSSRGKSLILTDREKRLLKGEEAIRKYAKNFGYREIEMGRAVDFKWLRTQSSIEVDTWLHLAGWNEFVEVIEPVYPKLIRILYANLDPNSMISWIGDKKVKLHVEDWCRVFNIPNLTTEEESEMRNMTKESIFHDLFKKRNLGKKLWVNTGDLPKDASTRLAANILMNVFIPKKGSKEQIKEEEGRVLFALMHGKDLNIAREIVDRVRQTIIRKSSPLCYPMHLMRIMKAAGVDLQCAGDTDIRELKGTSMIDVKTLGRLGFKRDHAHWNYVGRGHVRERFTAESHLPGEEEEEEGQEKGHEETGGHEESTAPSPQPTTSAIPSPSLPKTKTHSKFPPSQNFTQHIHNLQSTFSAQIAHLSSHLTEKLDYISATLHSRLDSVDTKLEALQVRLISCEAKLMEPKTQPSHTSPQPSPKPHTSQPSPPRAESPLFNMEELIQTTVQPIQIPSGSEATATTVPEAAPTAPESDPTIPKTNPLPQPISESTQPSPTPRTRTKKYSVKRATKDFSSSFQRKKPKPSR